MKRHQRKTLPETALGHAQADFERLKASIRAKVEHPFHVIKNLFGHRKTRYRGLAKNEAQLLALFGLGNRVLAKRHLLPCHAWIPSKNRDIRPKRAISSVPKA